MLEEHTITYPPLKLLSPCEEQTANAGLVLEEDEKVSVELVSERDEVLPSHSVDLLSEFKCEV